MAEPALQTLAEAVADGAELDWEQAETGAADGDRPAVAALRIVSSLAEVHRSLRSGLPGAGSDAAVASLEPGARWGRLEVLERLGAGSYGEVFRAYDPLLDRQVALKLLRPGRQPVRRDGRSPVEEARLLARVRHPNVAAVYGADEHDGRVGFWMELVEGRDLGRAVVERGLFGAREATLVGCELARALAAVHAEGIVHRDVKAQNVLREAGGRIVLTDFGIGLDLSRPEDLAGPAGTPYYLAPEVLAGEPAAPRSDVYALGVLLFHLVSGRFPVEGRSVEEIRRAHEAGERLWLRDLRPDLSAAFVAAVERALAPDPAERFASMGALERAFQALLSGAEAGARPRPGRVRRRVLAAAGVSVPVLVLAWVLSSELQLVDSRDRLPEPASEARELYQRALELNEEDEIDTAIELLEAAISEDPDFALAYSKLAVSLGGVGRFAEALEQSWRGYTLRDRADEAESAYVSAIYHLDRLQYREELRELQLLTELWPQDPDTQLQLAHAYRNLGERERAIDALRRAQDLVPEQPRYPGFIAILLAEGGRPEDALEVLRVARRRIPDPGVYFYWGEGLAHLVEDDFESAEDAFEALQAGGGIYAAVARQGLAQTYVASGRLDDAIRLLEIGAPERGYERSEARRLYRLARLRAMRDEVEEAERALAAMEEMSVLPIFCKQLREAAILHLELGKLGRARAILDRIEGMPAVNQSDFSRGAAAEIRGHLLAAEGSPAKALDSLREAQRYLHDPVTLRSLALYWLGRDDCREAMPYLEDIVERKGYFLELGFAGTWIDAQRELGRCRAELRGERAAESAAAGRL